MQSLIKALVSVVRRSGERADAEEGEKGDRETEESVGAEQRLWERVVMLMHETKVLDASDALRLLGLLSQKVRINCFCRYPLLLDRIVVMLCLRRRIGVLRSVLPAR